MAHNDDRAAIEAALASGDIAALWAQTESADRETRKAAKRALHLLRSRGVAVGTPPSSTSPASVPTFDRRVEETNEDCYLSAPDAAGEQLIFVPRKETKGYRLFQAMISDHRGVVAFEHLDVSRRMLHTILADFGSRGVELRPLGRALALAELAEAIPLDSQQPAAAKAVRELTELGVVAERGDPPSDRLATDRTALARSASLFEEPSLRGYLPERDVLRETAARLDEIAVSPLYLNERQRKDQFGQVLERAIEGYFDASRRARYARRLRGLAHWFAAGGEEDKRQLALAAASQLASTESALLNPFARTLFERAFSLPPEQEAPATKQPPPGSLIIAPG